MSLDKRSISRDYIDLIKDMYEGEVPNVRTACGETNELTVTIGFYQRLALSLCLSTLIIDELAPHIQEVPS